MTKLYQWYKCNGTDIYEGKYAIATSLKPKKGNKYFMLFVGKDGVNIDTNGGIIHNHFNSEHIGVWNDSKLVANKVKNIDKALQTKGIHKMVVNMPPNNTSFVYSVKKGSILMVLDEKHPEDEYHEMGHILSDTVNGGSNLRNKLESEQRAIIEEIKLKKKDGVYNQTAKNTLLNNASISVPSLGNKQKAIIILKQLENGIPMKRIKLGKEHIRYLKRSDEKNPYKKISSKAGRVR